MQDVNLNHEVLRKLKINILMKKFFSVITLTMSAIMLAVSCQKNHSPSTLTVDKYNTSSGTLLSRDEAIPDSMWGFYHNQGISLTEDYWSQPNPDNATLLNIISQRMAANFSQFTELTSQEKANLLSDPVFVALPNHKNDNIQQSTASLHGVLDTKLQNGQISLAIHDALYPAFDASLTFDEIMARINVINVSALSNDDARVLTRTKSILQNSHDYWTTYGQTHPDVARRLSNSQTVILVDGAYALGFIAVPIFSIIAATLASVCVSD